MKDKFTHLIVNGCSFAYSQGLEYSQKWSYLLGGELHLPLILLATPGASNDRIKRTTIEFLMANQHLPKEEFNPLCIICFTQSERREEWAEHQDKPSSVFFPYDFKELENYKSRTNSAFAEWSSALLHNMNRPTMLWNIRKKYLCWYETVCCVEHMNYTCLTTDYFPEVDELLFTEFCTDNFLLHAQIDNGEHRLENFEELTRDMEPLECGHDGIDAQDVLCKYLRKVIDTRFND